MLPKGRGVLFTIWASTADERQVAVFDLKSGEQKTLLRGMGAEYLDSGHLVYATVGHQDPEHPISGTLWAVAFDLDRLAVQGEPVRISDTLLIDVLSDINYAMSKTGTLAYVPARTHARSMAWLDRKGRETLIQAITPRPYETIALSPDGKRLAFAIEDRDADIWTWDIAGGGLTRLTFDSGSDSGPAAEYAANISPNGRYFAYQSAESGGKFTIWVQPYPDVTQGRWQISTGSGTAPVWARGGHELFYLDARGHPDGRNRRHLGPAIPLWAAGKGIRHRVFRRFLLLRRAAERTALPDDESDGGWRPESPSEHGRCPQLGRRGEGADVGAIRAGVCRWRRIACAAVPVRGRGSRTPRTIPTCSGGSTPPCSSQSATRPTPLSRDSSHFVAILCSQLGNAIPLRDHDESPVQAEHLNAPVLSEVVVEGEGPRDASSVEHGERDGVT